MIFCLFLSRARSETDAKTTTFFRDRTHPSAIPSSASNRLRNLPGRKHGKFFSFTQRTLCLRSRMFLWTRRIGPRGMRTCLSELSCLLLLLFLFFIFYNDSLLSDRVNRTRLRLFQRQSQILFENELFNKRTRRMSRPVWFPFPLCLLPCGDVTSLALHTRTLCVFLHIFMKSKGRRKKNLLIFTGRDL